MNPRWQVSFKGNGLTEDALDELAHRGISVVSYQTRPLGDGADLAATVWLRAIDGPEAISLVKSAIKLHGQFGDFTARLVNYSMYLGFLQSEAPEMEAAVRDIAAEDPRISSVLASDPSKGAAELLLNIPADDENGAIDQAKAIYADLRSRAGLPPAEALYGFLGRTGQFPTTPVVAPRRHEELGQQARKLFEDGMYNCAVITAQIACERLLLDGFTELLEAQGESQSALFANLWLKNNRTTSMTNKPLQELWTLMTGDKIQEKHNWWSDYKDHVVRRNGATHRGTEPTKAEADESLKATEAFRAHVSLKIQETLEREV